MARREREREGVEREKVVYARRLRISVCGTKTLNSIAASAVVPYALLLVFSPPDSS